MSSPQGSSGGPQELTLRVREPGDAAAERQLAMDAGSTIRDLKLKLQEVHPKHPQPVQQRLVVAGKVLTDDDATISAAVRWRGWSEDVPPIHLVILSPAAASPAQNGQARAPVEQAVAPSAVRDSPLEGERPNAGPGSDAREQPAHSEATAAHGLHAEGAPAEAEVLHEGCADPLAAASAQQGPAHAAVGPAGSDAAVHETCGSPESVAAAPVPVAMHPVMAAAYTAAYAELTRASAASGASPVVQPVVYPLHMPPVLALPVSASMPGPQPMSRPPSAALVQQLRAQLRASPDGNRRVRLILNRRGTGAGDGDGDGAAAAAPPRGPAAANGGAWDGAAAAPHPVGAPQFIWRFNIYFNPRRLIQILTFLAFALYALPLRRFLVVATVSLLYMLNLHALIQRALIALARGAAAGVPQRDPAPRQGGRGGDGDGHEEEEHWQPQREEEGGRQGIRADGVQQEHPDRNGQDGAPGGAGGARALAPDRRADPAVREAPIERLRDAISDALRRRRRPARRAADEAGRPGDAGSDETGEPGAAEAGSSQGQEGGAEREEPVPLQNRIVALGRAAFYVVLSFVLSLLPGFEQDARDADAIAAAQEEEMEEPEGGNAAPAF